VLDYYGIGKAGYWYLRRAFAPVLASFQPLTDGGVCLWMTNDTLAPLSDLATVTRATFEGETLATDSVPIDVPANTSAVVRRWTLDELSGGPNSYLRVESANNVFAPNQHFFAAIKDLVRSPEAPTVSITQETATRLTVNLTAAPRSYTILTRVALPVASARYSDNAFDLAPSERREVRIESHDAPITPEMVDIRWL